MAHFAKDVDNFSAARTVRITGSENIENYTLYTIEVILGPYSWTVQHRYSDFHDLHEKLVSTCKLEKNLLPPKKLFGNQSESFIKKRQGDLETYLQAIMYFLVNRLPPALSYFLDFNKYEIHGITHSLAEELYTQGDSILQTQEKFVMTPLQLHSLTERLKLPEPTCDSGDMKKDIGHILDFITRLKHLKIVGTRDPVGSSNIDMNLLKFDLSLFKSLKSLQVLNGNVLMIRGLDTVKETLETLEIHHSVRAVRDMILQELPHWRSEDGSMLTNPWSRLKTADFSHNNIISIDDTLQLLSTVEVLDLSHNTIEGIEHIQWLSHLTHLNLSHNVIRHLDALHTKLGNLKSLDLSGNKLDSLQGFSKLFSLEVLNVSNNEISQIVEVRHISKLPCLECVLFLGNTVMIVPDYRNKVLEVFGDRAAEITLDNKRATAKELDTVAVLQAIQKAKEVKERPIRRSAHKAAVTEVPILDPDAGPQMSSSHDSTTAVIGWSVTDPQSLSNDPDIFRLQVEAIREQGGEAWLSLLNQLQASPNHTQARELLSSLSSVASSDDHKMSPSLSASSTRTVYPSSWDPSTQPSLHPATPHGHRHKSVSIATPDHGYVTRFIDQDKLPAIEDRIFIKHLMSQLLSVELMFSSGKDDVETIRQILWCHAIQYSNPSDKQVVCVALTDKHIFVQRLKGVTGRINSFGSSTIPETETYYIMPLSNIQKIVIGRDENYLRLEESFVGANGTFTLVGLQRSCVSQFVSALLSIYRHSMRLGEGLEQPDLLDMSVTGVELLKLAISQVEKLPSPKDVDIIFSCLTFIDGCPSCLVITDHTLYLFRDYIVTFPPPTFEISNSVREEYSLCHRIPVMTQIQNMELFNTSGLMDRTSYTSITANSLHFEHYGICLTLDIDEEGTDSIEIVFLTVKMRDEFLERLTQLRFDHAQKLSPLHRGEPEGGNEASETESEQETLQATSDSDKVQVVVHSEVTNTESNAETTADVQRETYSEVQDNDLKPETFPDFQLVVQSESQESNLKSDCDDQVSTRTRRSFTSLELGYPGTKLVGHLTECLSKYSLISPLPAKLQFLKAMPGDEFVKFFHNNLSKIVFEPEELRHVVWAHVVPYCNPQQEILSLIVLSTRAIYMLSHDHIKGKHGRPSWMTHERHKSDSMIGQNKVSKDQHHTSGILHVGTGSRRIPKAFKTLPLTDIKLINVGLFDQYFRLTGHDEENVLTVITRNCYVTEEFLRHLTQVFSLVSTSPTPDVADEVDFYRSFATRTKSTAEGLEYRLNSKMRFCYPGEESLSDLTYLINDSLSDPQPRHHATHIWLYLLGYAYMGPYSDDLQSKVQSRGIILTDQHLCLIKEDLVSYPLPDFVRGLPECARQEVIEGRKVEYLKSVSLHSDHALSLQFSDISEDIFVDTSFEYYGVDKSDGGRASPPLVTWTLYIQSTKEKEKFLKLLSRQWSELHDGTILLISQINPES